MSLITVIREKKKELKEMKCAVAVTWWAVSGGLVVVQNEVS